MKGLVRDAGWVTLSHLSAALAVLALQVVLARTLPPAMFGSFILAQAIVQVVESTLMSRAGEVSTYWLGRFWKVDFGTAQAYSRHLVRREFFWNSVTTALLVLASAPLSMALGLDWWLIPTLAFGLLF